MKGALVTGFFLLALASLIVAGVNSRSPEPVPVVVQDPWQNVRDSHFAQYLEYVARRDDGSMNCR